ncbi:low temperature requirement protein A [Nocardia sp. NRRL S-836]|uniref:low temperature requirement protein A n=1 Tax=Nocardia sp. NRRL S-836 TaxID=1519492 RepID=UPI001E3AEE8E|nr:low temperature requirement protein A [Nocardia sp. NRRL S-836]
MGLALFMNAGTANAFNDAPRLFTVPMMLALAVPATYAAVAATTPHLRRHFRHVLLWMAASAPFWIIGAIAGPEIRIWWWAGAAGIDLIGTWTAPPVPGNTRRGTQRLEFDAAHMLERMRLFLIILLGETVLTLGRVIADHPSEPATLLTALGVFLALICLWAVYFGRAEQLVVRRVSASEDPIRSVHVGMNVIYGVVAGLVMLAAGSETLIAHAQDRAGVSGVLLLAGPAIYLLSQAIYFHLDSDGSSLPRYTGAAVLTAVPPPGTGSRYTPPSLCSSSS